jgi:hypothetical protein
MAKRASPALDLFEPSFGAQRAFYDDPSRFALAGAGVRTGKTYAAARKFLKRVLRESPTKRLRTYWVIGPTYDEVIAQKIELADLIPDHLVDWKRQKRDQRFRDIKTGTGKVHLKGGALIEFKSAGRPEGLVARKVDGVWWTEIARSKQAAWPNVRSRLSNTNGWLIADTSPMGRCWFYTDVWKPALDGGFPGAGCHQWTAMDSPHIPDSEVQEARESLSPEFFKRDYEASWDSFSGQIYPSWSRQRHVEENHAPGARWILGADINTGEQPAAFVVCKLWGAYVSPTGRKLPRIHVESEYYERIGLDYEGYAQTIADAVMRHRRGGQLTRLVIDPSMHNEFKHQLRAAGVSPHNADNARMEGIRTVGSLLQIRSDESPLLTVDPSCTNLMDEIEGYAWKRTSSGIITEEPDKSGADHLMDALRYACMDAYDRGTARQVR